MYNITEGTTATKGNELGIFEDLGDYYAQEDLDLFFATVYPYVSHTVHYITNVSPQDNPYWNLTNSQGR